VIAFPGSSISSRPNRLNSRLRRDDWNKPSPTGPMLLAAGGIFFCQIRHCSSGYKLNFNAIWVLYVEGVIVVAAVGERVPFVVETGNVVV
jgi:hypothetical protein